MGPREDLGQINERNERAWHWLMLQHEAALLERERRHLAAKSLERPLTQWERRRFYDLSLELLHVNAKLTQRPLHCSRRCSKTFSANCLDLA